MFYYTCRTILQSYNSYKAVQYEKRRTGDENIVNCILQNSFNPGQRDPIAPKHKTSQMGLMYI